MNLYIYSSSDLSYKGTITNFKSLIWTDRWRTAGDFELVVPLNDLYENVFALDDILYLSETLGQYTNAMIVEKIDIKGPTDTEIGTLTISGRDILSLLDRRVLLEDWDTSSNPLSSIQTVIRNNLIAPSDSNRKIDLLIQDTQTISSYGNGNKYTWEETEDEYLLNGVIGDSIYDIVYTLLSRTDDLWVKRSITANMREINKLGLYYDASDSDDHSYYGKNLRTLVISDGNKLIRSWSIYMTNTEVKNVGVIIGDNDIFVTTYIENTEPTGLGRREGTWTPENMDKRSSESTTKYKTRLTTKGQELLREQESTILGDLTLYTKIAKLSSTFKYLSPDITNCGLGFYLNFSSRYWTAAGRITEVIHSWDLDNGEQHYSTVDIENISFKEAHGMPSVPTLSSGAMRDYNIVFIFGAPYVGYDYVKRENVERRLSGCEKSGTFDEYDVYPILYGTTTLRLYSRKSDGFPIKNYRLRVCGLIDNSQLTTYAYEKVSYHTSAYTTISEFNVKKSSNIKNIEGYDSLGYTTSDSNLNVTNIYVSGRRNGETTDGSTYTDYWVHGDIEYRDNADDEYIEFSFTPGNTPNLLYSVGYLIINYKEEVSDDGTISYPTKNISPNWTEMNVRFENGGGVIAFPYMIDDTIASSTSIRNKYSHLVSLDASEKYPIELYEYSYPIESTEFDISNALFGNGLSYFGADSLIIRYSSMTDNNFPNGPNICYDAVDSYTHNTLKNNNIPKNYILTKYTRSIRNQYIHSMINSRYGHHTLFAICHPEVTAEQWLKYDSSGHQYYYKYFDGYFTYRFPKLYSDLLDNPETYLVNTDNIGYSELDQECLVDYIEEGSGIENIEIENISGFDI